ncbi:FAD-dependent oxidoreductase [Chitinimonas lacunae]|uniref:FAD-dependent oxidoreductase n=1 Tax=Chitinimonas lacunae TaxID=1963018 RepID=A0ABV8MU28_9NEIS
MRVGVIGAGVIGLLFARRCAARQIKVDLFDAEALPNPKGRSVDISRLFRVVHPQNPELQRLAVQSRAYWLKWDQQSGGGRLRPARCYRCLDTGQAATLAGIYQQLGLEYQLYRPAEPSPLDAHYRVDQRLTVLAGQDAYVLNSQLILADLLRQLDKASSVRRHERCRVHKVGRDPAGNLYLAHDKGLSFYDVVFVATSAPTLLPEIYPEYFSTKPVLRHQFFLNVQVEGKGNERHMPPVLDLGDEVGSWVVPGFEPDCLKISAASFAFADEGFRQDIDHYTSLLLSRLKHRPLKVEPYVVPYYEIPHRAELDIPYIKQSLFPGVYIVDSCDAGLFKAAPALVDELCHTVFQQHGVNFAEPDFQHSF